MKSPLVVCAVCVLASPAFAQPEKKPAAFSRMSGGSIQTKLSGSIVVNKNSSLEREWLTLHDPGVPVELLGTVGVTTAYERDGGARGEYHYKAAYAVQPAEPLSAIEVRFLVFDLWGGHVRTLVSDEVIDLPANASHDFSAEWRIWSENEVSRHYASIAYISRVRTKDGRVIEADPATVIQEAKKFSKKFAAADLEPKAEQKP